MSESRPEEAGIASVETAEQPLPKLSITDFRMYNRMAEHMDAFVSLFPYLRRLSDDTYPALPLSLDLEDDICRLFRWQTARRHVDQIVSPNRAGLLSPSDHAPHSRRTSIIPCEPQHHCEMPLS